MYIQYITDHVLNSIQIIQVISKVGDLVGIKYFPVEQEKTASVDKQKKLQ
jgi:serine palmitoyltransferase